MSEIYWKNRQLPLEDIQILEKIGISYHDLVFTDYREIWPKFSDETLTKSEVQRLKHIRKREKNKLFMKTKDKILESTMLDLKNEKEELVHERNKLVLEREYWKLMFDSSMQKHHL